MNKAFSFVREVRVEFSKVAWPGREELVDSVMIVCFLVALCAIVLGSMDGAFGYLIKGLLGHLA